MIPSTPPRSDGLLPAILATLERRLAVISDRKFYDRDPAGHLAALRQISEELDGLVASLPADTDPMLRHYLERQSYLKAIDWLRDHLSISQ